MDVRLVQEWHDDGRSKEWRHRLDTTAFAFAIPAAIAAKSEFLALTVGRESVRSARIVIAAKWYLVVHIGAIIIIIAAVLIARRK